jgi:alginate O-acetyltransferase complex protein AlgJ
VTASKGLTCFLRRFGCGLKTAFRFFLVVGFFSGLISVGVVDVLSDSAVPFLPRPFVPAKDLEELERTRAVAQFRNGTAARLVEFEARLFSRFRRPFTHGASMLQWVVARDLGDGILLGKEGWMFLTAPLEPNPHAEERAQEFCDLVVELRDHLRQKGVRLIIMPIPAKLTVMEHALPTGVSAPAVLRTAHELLMMTLGQDAIDLTKIWREQDIAQPFLRTDSHWSPDGSRVAAEAAAAVAGVLLPKDLRPYALRDLGSHPDVGDLFRFVGVSAVRLSQNTWERTLATRLHLIHRVHAMGVTHGEGASERVFDTKGPPPSKDASVALLGTSYCATRLFEGYVAHFSGGQMRVDAVVGGGLYSAVKAALRRLESDASYPRTWIWEFPMAHVLYTVAPELESLLADSQEK